MLICNFIFDFPDHWEPQETYVYEFEFKFIIRINNLQFYKIKSFQTWVNEKQYKARGYSI